jgi:hypothetical protein
MSRQTPSSVGSANGSANSGPGFLSRSTGVEVAPAPPQNFAGNRTDGRRQSVVARTQDSVRHGILIHDAFKRFERIKTGVLRRYSCSDVFQPVFMSKAGKYFPASNDRARRNDPF